jgi:two-component system, OmpR family, sensor histidine kinase VicK
VVISQNNNNNNNCSERTEILHGEENVMNAILQFLSKAYRIDSCGDHRAPSVAIGAEEYKELLLDLKNRGTKLRFITDITKENIHYCKQVMKFAEEVRHIDGIKANFFVSETEYVATAARQEALPVPQVIYSNVKDIVVQQQYVFEAFWNRAIFADQKIREIEEGLDFGKTEIIQDSYAAKELFINMVRSAADEILLIIPTVNAFYREERIGVIQLIKEAAEQRGVKVKVLIPSNDIIDKILQKPEKCEEEKKEKQKGYEIRRIDLTSDIKSTILVIDRKSSLVTELRDDSKENFVQAIGSTSYSTSKPTVLSYTSIFENFWKQVELYEQLKIHDRMQKEFINVAAHELRSPIQPILGLSEVLKSKEGNIKEYNELIDVINRNAKRLRQLTEDILDVARIEGKLLNLRKSRFDLKELILNTIADHTSQIIREGKDNNNNKVKIELAPKEGKEVYDEIFIDGDRERITQVISNLLNNAIKFTEEGTIIVDIEERKNNKHSNNKETAAIVVVNIQDTGKGIDPAIRDKLFEKFTTTSEKGMGLGLYLSRKIIESHGGEIWAANNTNSKGATFGFSLPANSSL